MNTGRRPAMVSGFFVISSFSGQTVRKRSVDLTLSIFF